jgi:hypothetical protein
MVSKIQLTKKKLTKVLMPPEASQVMAIARMVVSAETVIAEVAEVEIAKVETKASAMKPEVVTEATVLIAEIVLSVETVETVEIAEVVNVEEVSAEEANVEVESVVSADPKVKVVKLKSTVVEIVPELQDLPDKKVVIFLDKMTMEKEEVAPAATEVVSEVAVVEPILLLLTQAELILDLSVMVSPEAEVASEEDSEEAAVASEVREEKVDSTDLKVEINPDASMASIPEAEVAREEVVLLVATVEEMPLSLPLEYHREIFENYDL